MDYQKEGKAVIQIEQAAISQLESRINDIFSKACRLILNSHGRLIVMGIGKSGHIGNKIAATFASTGTPAFFVHPAEAVHGDLGMITKEDIVLLISYSGSTPELMALIDPVTHIGAKIISMTGKPSSPLATTAHIHLDVSVSQEACPLGLAPTASTTAALVMGDALAVAVLKARGFTAEQFGMIHPGGTLGRRLSVKIENLMVAGDQVPQVLISATFSEALTEIQQKKLGMTTVIHPDHTLAGIFTDGDIRRALVQGMLDLKTPIQDLISKNPKTLGPHDQAIGAINLMETYKITSLVITDSDQKVLGVLHMHHLLSSGLI